MAASYDYSSQEPKSKQKKKKRHGVGHNARREEVKSCFAFVSHFISLICVCFCSMILLSLILIALSTPFLSPSRDARQAHPYVCVLPFNFLVINSY